ncbi:hypothetical protein JCM1393_23390 [Clostridium carnis]
MKEFKIFKVLEKFRGLYEKAGIDYDVMKIILSAKFTMDGRRTSTVLNANKKKDDNSNQFYKSLWMYVVMGLFLMITMVFKVNIMYQMSVYFSGFMFMVLTVFISDFSTVILDIRDKNIIGTKGVSSKTINAAKFTHVFIYILYLTLALAGFSLLASIRYGILFFIIFLIEIILIDLFMIMITALMYFVVLKFFDGEKLKDMINVVQIILTVGMIIGYQIVPRIFSVIGFEVTYTSKPWHYLMAPMWFAAPLEMVIERTISLNLVIMTLLAIVIPIVSIVIYLKLTPAFEKYLQKFNNNVSKDVKNSKVSHKFSNIICRNRTEKAFFNFTIDIIQSERDFKLKIYPILVMSLIFPFIFMSIGFHGVNSFQEWKVSLQSSKLYLNIYAAFLMIPNILLMIGYSEKYKGSWIYGVVPINNIEYIFKGVIKGVIYKLIAPIFIILSMIFVWLFSWNVIKHLIIVYLAVFLMIMILFKLMKKSLPFSKKFEPTNGGESIISLFTSAFVILIVIGSHFIASLFTFGIYVYGVLLILLNIILWKKVFNIQKDKLIN